MRPGQHQQNRRGRGRNNGNTSQASSSSNNNRKGGNPLSRSFESNGPDVKVRGTPAHIAEKYLTLARDAQTSGDRVLAENYLQHAEHYNRIIMAYREQFQTPGEVPAGSQPRRMPGMDGFDLADEMGDDDGNGDGGDDFGGGPQPNSAQTANAAPQSGANEGGNQGGNYNSNQGGNPGNSQGGQHQRQPYRQDNRGDGRQDRFERNGNGDRNGDNQNRGDRPFRRDGQQNNRFRDRNDRNDRNGNRPQPPNANPNAGGNANGNGGGNANSERGAERPFEPRFDRNDARNDGSRGDFRGDRGPRPDRPVRVERPVQAHVQPTSHQPQADMAPLPQNLVEAPLTPVFVSSVAVDVPVPASIAIPTVAPATPTRRRQPASEAAVAGNDTPEFLRRPVRRSRAAVAPVADAAPEVSVDTKPAVADTREPDQGS